MSNDANRENTGLSRRAFLTGLTTLAVGSAAALTIGANAADAATVANVPGEPKGPTRKTPAEDKPTRKTPAEDKKVEVAQNGDPLQAFNQPYYRHRRRVARRTYRRGRRVVRRTYRRTRRVY